MIRSTRVDPCPTFPFRFFLSRFLFGALSLAGFALAGGPGNVFLKAETVAAFAPTAYYETGYLPERGASGDFNGDGFEDLVLGYLNGGTTVLFNDGEGRS